MSWKLVLIVPGSRLTTNSMLVKEISLPSPWTADTSVCGERALSQYTIGETGELSDGHVTEIVSLSSNLGVQCSTSSAIGSMTHSCSLFMPAWPASRALVCAQREKM